MKMGRFCKGRVLRGFALMIAGLTAILFTYYSTYDKDYQFYKNYKGNTLYNLVYKNCTKQRIFLQVLQR